MIPIPHGFLTIPRPAEQTAPRLLRKVRMLAVRALHTVDAAPLAPDLRRATLDAQRCTLAGLRATPDAVLAAFGGPEVLLPLLSIHSRARPVEPMLELCLPHLLFGLARRAPRRVFGDTQVLWERPFGRLVDGAAVMTFAPSAVGFVAGPTGLEVRLADGTLVDATAGATAADALLPLDDRLADLRLATFDTNPLAMEEAHPDKQGNTLTFGDKPATAWTTGMGAAIDLIGDTLPSLLPELSQTFFRMVPVGFEPQVHMSASYRQGPGIIYMTLHPSIQTLAEAIVHETQHGKLNLLSWLDPILENGHSEWCASPVRPDLRPLMGVLLAVHAFAPVAAMLARMAERDHPLTHSPRFPRRFAQVVGANQTAVDTLRKLAQPTATGRRVLDAIYALHEAVLPHAPSGVLATGPERWPG